MLDTKCTACEYLVCIVPELRAGRSGVRIPVGSRDFSLLENVGTCFGSNSASFSMDTVDPSGGSGAGA